MCPRNGPDANARFAGQPLNQVNGLNLSENWRSACSRKIDRSGVDLRACPNGPKARTMRTGQPRLDGPGSDGIRTEEAENTVIARRCVVVRICRDFLTGLVKNNRPEPVRRTDCYCNPAIARRCRHDPFWQSRDKQKRQKQDRSYHLPYLFVC